MERIKISAIVPVFNGSNYIQRAVQSLLDQSLGPDEYEVIVVDNASTDNTRDIVGSMLHNKNLKYIYEPVVGASSARNTGAGSALAEYIAFLDSDQTADRDWLRLIVETFEGVRPMPACVGGKILLKWEVAKPDWFPERYFSALGRLDYGNEPRFLSGGITLFAGNMALQRKIFLELGGFNVDFGKKDGVGLYAEEPELLSRLRKKGYSVFYQPSVLAEHFVPAERATKKCLYRRKYITGRSEALFLHEQRKRGETLFLVKNLLLRPMHMILLVLKYLFHSTTHQPDKALTDMVSIYRDCGYFIQCGRLMLL